MTKDEALKLALEALEEINKLSIGENAICLPAEIDTAMDAIKEALAQPEQRNLSEQEHDVLMNAIKASSTVVSKGFLAQPEQEPVAWRWGVPKLKTGDFEWRYSLNQTRPDAIPLYTTPPQRTWVGLTDEEISELIRATHNTGSFVRAIEAKLKEKNT